MVAPQKARLPWLKLARFGTVRTDKNSLRHDANMLSIGGIEADYDLERIGFDEAVEIAEKAGLACIIYTSPSHTEAKPRWRVLCFTSCELKPADRDIMMARLNGLYRGVFSTESFTRSQSYYYGRVVDSREHRVEILDGECIDLLDELDEIAIGKPNGSAGNGHASNGSGGPIDEAALTEAIVSGDASHTASVRLVGKWAQSGVPFLDAQHGLEQLFDNVFPPDRDRRWHTRRADIPRIVRDIYGKEARKKDEAAATGDPFEDYGNGRTNWQKEAFEEDFSKQQAKQQPGIIHATPFSWIDPTQLPRREWLYGRHLIRRFLSCTIAPGGYGKSSLIVAEALAMVSGHALLGEQPTGQLRVWQINLEDPEDELRRRVAAAAIHYKLKFDDIGDRLFIDSGRRLDLVIARQGRNGVEIAAPIVGAIKAEIIDKQIDVLQVDPFVACHSVAENDNTAVAAVARQWAMIAEATGCAIELVHHARKNGNQGGFTVDDARGASALIAAVRSARVLNGMSKDEAERASIEDPAAYFNIANGKANLAPRSDKAMWRHIIGVPLNNGNQPFDRHGDFVGVVEPWSWPDPFADVSLEDAKAVQRRIADGEWREDQRSTTWAGIAVGEVLGLDVADKGAKTLIRALVTGWLSTGALRAVKRKDEQRRDRKFIEVSQWLT